VSLLFISIRFYSIPLKIFADREKAGIKIMSVPSGADVFIDSTLAGKTPFEDVNLKSKQISVKLQSGSTNWVGGVPLNPGTVTILNREISENEASASGEILTLTVGAGASIISDPTGAEVEVDGKAYGKTPINVDVGSGEHIFVLNKKGYLKRSVKALVPPGFTLGLNVDLALSELDLTNIATTPINITPKLKVTKTPTGFLRVRDKPSLSGKEITRVLEGDELISLEDLNSWMRVRLNDGKEGFVSSDYVEKVNP